MKAQSSELRAQNGLIVQIAVVALMALFVGAGVSHAAITMDLDRTTIDFRSLNTGQTSELADQGTYHNQVTCSSTNNKTWYLKAHLVRPFTSGMNTIPAENFQWMVVSIGNGRGMVTNSINVPTSFSTIQSTIYTSAETDNTGTEVKIQFRYILTIPKNQVAGGYDAIVRLMMVESL